MKDLRNINALNSSTKLQYFGTYRGVEWILTGLRDGNKVWWYLTDQDGELPQPAENLKSAAIDMKNNIDYDIENK